MDTRRGRLPLQAMATGSSRVVSPMNQHWRSRGFLVVGGMGVAGTLVGQLGATSATTAASTGTGGLTTAIFLALILVSAGLSGLFTGRLMRRWSLRAIFAAAQAGVAVSWILVGVIEATTDSGLLVLFAAAPIFGIFSGITALLTPLATRAYLGKKTLAASVSLRSAVSGVAAIIGAVVGGHLISETYPALGIAANGVLTIPLALFVMLVKPFSDQPTAHEHGYSVRRLAEAVRSSPQLRRVLILIVGSVIFIAPFQSLIVPVLNSVDHNPLPSGAGLVLAGLAAGRLLTPTLVKRFQARQDDFPAAIWATLGAAAFMAVFGASFLLEFSETELVLWTLLGFALGSMRFTYRALLIGAAASALPDQREVEGLAAAATVGIFSAPIGILAWGVMLDFTSAPITMAASAICMVALAILMMGTKRTRVRN